MAQENRQLADALERAGYFADLQPSEAEQVRAETAATGYSGALSHPTRVTFADSEDLAEGGVADWINAEVAPMLAAHGVQMPTVEQRFPEDASGNSVVVNGKEYWMWREGDKDVRTWGTSTVGAFQVVNDTLAAAGVAERLYLVGGGNDGTAWLLTPAQADIIRELGRVERRSWPYIPIDNGSDWFGQPH